MDGVTPPSATLGPLIPFGYNHNTKETLRVYQNTTLFGQIEIARREFHNLNKQRLNFT